jgi:hypothetical protein
VGGGDDAYRADEAVGRDRPVVDIDYVADLALSKHWQVDGDDVEYLPEAVAR